MLYGLIVVFVVDFLLWMFCCCFVDLCGCVVCVIVCGCVACFCACVFVVFLFCRFCVYSLLRTQQVYLLYTQAAGYTD